MKRLNSTGLRQALLVPTWNALPFDRKSLPGTHCKATGNIWLSVFSLTSWMLAAELKQRESKSGRDPSNTHIAVQARRTWKGKLVQDTHHIVCSTTGGLSDAAIIITVQELGYKSWVLNYQATNNSVFFLGRDIPDSHGQTEDGMIQSQSLPTPLC